MESITFEAEMEDAGDFIHDITVGLGCTLTYSRAPAEPHGTGVDCTLTGPRTAVLEAAYRYDLPVPA